MILYWDKFIGRKYINVSKVLIVAASNIEATFNALSTENAVIPQQRPQAKLATIPTILFVSLVLELINFM